MKTYKSYEQLKKPKWAPPAWLFGPIWTFLYAVIAVSYIAAGYGYFTGKVPFVVILPFILNLIFNLAFTPLQFGLKNLALASIDVVLTWATLLWAMIAVFPYIHWVSYANIPYLAWTSFATVLQLTITYMNRRNLLY